MSKVRGTGSSFPVQCIIVSVIFIFTSCNGNTASSGREGGNRKESDSPGIVSQADEPGSLSAMLVVPACPRPGEPFRIISAGGNKIRAGRLRMDAPSGHLEPEATGFGDGSPGWRIDSFAGGPAGSYSAELISGKDIICKAGFEVGSRKDVPHTGTFWDSRMGWDPGYELLYSAWINALFHDYNEDASWSSLHMVTRNRERNFLYDYLSLGEDDTSGKSILFMQPDCADNPFFLRAYFAWKLGLPFGYHLCDRGSLTRNPKTGQWITNESKAPGNNPVDAFNAFLRRVADGVHSGTARTALDDENSDYYPVSLVRESLRPGTVFADPYGHTLILVNLQPQKGKDPGLLLAVDAQPDGTVGIKRFWQGNFLFNTSGVIGEPGFKAFRPIAMTSGAFRPLRNAELTSSSGYIPYSLQQRKMKSGIFYKTMERLINPSPLDPETALLDQIGALHEQLKVRVTSVANGEAYMKSHPGTVIPMPSGASGIFLAGGQWENFSTPNRDLRLLIAMDAVADFPDKVAGSPQDFNIRAGESPDQVKARLRSLLEKTASGLSISYTRSDGSVQNLTISEILERRDAFETAYNPNDCIEIRWGAPENSAECSSCRRHAPPRQDETMRSVRVWFHKRLHPPT